MRKFLATMLTVIMILCAMLCASACGGANAPAPSDPDTSTDPSGNENGGNGNNNNNEDKDDDPYAKYSQVLQNVLKKSHYVNLADEYKALKDSDSNRFYPHPYGLFEDLGLNVQAIKNDDLECHTRTYIKNNDKNTLYVTTRVEGVGSTPYYKCITASYSLTDKEYQDLYDMHNHYYIQAPLFIQELSYCKKANVIYNANMAKDTYDIMVEGICKSTKIKSYFDSPAFEYDFIGYDLNTQQFRAIIRTSSRLGRKMIDTKAQMSMEICSMTIQDITVDGNIFLGPKLAFSADWDEFEKNITDITYFESQNCAYKNTYDYKYLR